MSFASRLDSTLARLAAWKASAPSATPFTQWVPTILAARVARALLVGMGNDGPFPPPHEPHSLNDVMPPLEVVLFENCGHFPDLDNLVRFARLVDDTVSFVLSSDVHAA
ncbi:MAG: hypothetical protein JWQ11_1565 [Rhizobacter sp.]|nr:hypothetical protein [Rhizobacter sp.]